MIELVSVVLPVLVPPTTRMFLRSKTAWTIVWRCSSVMMPAATYSSKEMIRGGRLRMLKHGPGTTGGRSPWKRKP